jgi:predicted RNA binding protein YcfA (HicA-like mRNA interferase family)
VINLQQASGRIMKYKIVLQKLPGINHQQAVQALEKPGFRIVRQGKHIVMTDGMRILTIPRCNAINAITIWGIMRDAGLPIEGQ